MNQKRKIRKNLVWVCVALGLYPLFVLIYTWVHVLQSSLEGGRHGPLDAYRHALASAVVAYTLGDPAVKLVTDLMESKGKESNRMDRHNNRIGALIGAHATSFAELEPSVRQKVSEGWAESKAPDCITWMPAAKWRSVKLW